MGSDLDVRRSVQGSNRDLTPKAEYARRIARWGDVVRRGEQTHLVISNLRLAFAAAAALVAWLAFGRNALSPAWLVVPALGFVALVVTHARVLQRNERAFRARRLYEHGIERLDGRWMGRGPDGSRFLDEHGYTRDLDLFGLQAGHSRFYTEILRIRSIVEIARGPLPVLFLLDEILHGTNSHDRRIGAEAIVRALVEAGAIGLLTTHDLALTELVAKLQARAANVHFEDRIDEGRVVFDYRMRAGVVERSNALALMRAVGLDV